MRATMMTLLMLAAAVCVGCDLVVAPGDTLTLRGGVEVFGSTGDGVVRAVPAVTVDRGTLIVDDALLLGGLTIAESPELLPPELGGGIVLSQPGIRATVASLRLGSLARVVGGPAQDRVVRDVQVIASSGIVASGSRILVEPGARVIGGTATTPNDPMGAQGWRTDSGAGILMTGRSDLTVTGGHIQGGVRAFPLAVIVPGDGLPNGPAVSSVSSSVTISGGFVESLQVVNSRVEITGGTIRGLIQTRDVEQPRIDPLLPGPTCTQIRGGSIEGILFASGRITLVGSGFNLPLGRVPLEPSTNLLRITGTLENGDPLSVVLRTDLRLTDDAELTLAAPGTEACQDAVIPAPF